MRREGLVELVLLVGVCVAGGTSGHERNSDMFLADGLVPLSTGTRAR